MTSLPSQPVPYNGRITAFRTQSSRCSAPAYRGVYDFQVLGPEGDGQYLVVGDTGNQTDPCDGRLQTYAVDISVQADDVLGVYIVTPWVGVLNGGSVANQGPPAGEPAPGQTVSMVGAGSGPYHVDESATLRR